MSLSGYPDLDAVIEEFIAAFKERREFPEREQEAWERFFELKTKYWKLEHPEVV